MQGLVQMIKTKTQKDSCLNVENTVRIINMKIIGEFKEHISGDTSPFERPIFQKLMELKPEAVVVFSIDRLTRQHPTKTMNLLIYFKDAGMKVVSISEPIFNMDSPFSEPMQYFLTWWNNYFLKKLKEDIKSGMDKARKEGRVPGRPKAKFNEFRAYELLFNQNIPLRDAASELGTSTATLHRFKKGVKKNPNSFIKKGYGSISDVFETKGENNGK